MRMLTDRRPYLCTIVVLLAALCAIGVRAGSPAGPQTSGPNGARYQLYSPPGQDCSTVYRIDTTTGETWVLSQGSSFGTLYRKWERIPN